MEILRKTVSLVGFVVKTGAKNGKIGKGKMLNSVRCSGRNFGEVLRKRLNWLLVKSIENDLSSIALAKGEPIPDGECFYWER